MGCPPSWSSFLPGVFLGGGGSAGSSGGGGAVSWGCFDRRRRFGPVEAGCWCACVSVIAVAVAMCEWRGNGLLYDGRYVRGCLRPRSLRIVPTAVCVYTGEGRGAERERSQARRRLRTAGDRKFSCKLTAGERRLPWGFSRFAKRSVLGDFVRSATGPC